MATAADVAERLIALVISGLPVGGTRGDTAGLVMHGAYLRALRRFDVIKQVAAMGAGEEAMILARSLLSIVARAVWVDIPDDPVERRHRYEAFAKQHLTETIRTLEGLTAVGLGESDDAGLVDGLREDLEKVKHATRFPDDRRLLAELNLETFYQRVYRTASDFAHFSLGVAITELQGAEEVHYERDEAVLAREALELAIITYDVFLFAAQRTIRHGLYDRVKAITLGLMPETDDAV
jgi:hypothetical protein